MTADCFPCGKESLGALTYIDRKIRRGGYETDVDRGNLEVSSLAVTPKDVQLWTSRTPNLPASSHTQARRPPGCAESQGQPELAGHSIEM